MKKIITCILLIVLIFNLTVSAEMQFKLSADADEAISTKQELKANEIIKVIVLNSGDFDANSIEDLQNNLLYFNVLTPPEDGSKVGVTVDFSSFTSKKIYKIYAISAHTSNSNNTAQDLSNKYIELGYANLSDRNQYMLNIKNSLNEGVAQIKEKLETEGIYLGIDYEMFKLASSAAVAQIMFSDKDRLNTETADLKSVVAFIDDAVLVNVLNGSNKGKVTTEYIENLICNDERYANIRNGFDSIPQENRANILADIAGKSFATYGELEQQIKNSVAINAFNYTNTNANNLFAILCEYATIVSPNLTLGVLSGMSNSARSSAIMSLYEKKYTSIETLKIAIDALKPQDAIINAPQGGAGGGGGGESGGGGSLGFSVPSGSSSDMTPFTDMGSYKWAEDALYYLAQKKIISGYGDNKFKPENNITRAEFVKIIVSCFFNENSAYEINFEDVGADKWYSKYIAAAMENKIVSGLSDTEFGPDRYMTRQDMAVVLYNTAQMTDFEMETDAADIADDEEISEYAKTAVYALKNAGIINGYEDGSFKPKNNANRAETVQMVYNFLIKKGELENEED